MNNKLRTFFPNLILILICLSVFFILHVRHIVISPTSSPKGILESSISIHVSVSCNSSETSRWIFFYTWRDKGLLSWNDDCHICFFNFNLAIFCLFMCQNCTLLLINHYFMLVGQPNLQIYCNGQLLSFLYMLGSVIIKGHNLPENRHFCL